MKILNNMLFWFTLTVIPSIGFAQSEKCATLIKTSWIKKLGIKKIEIYEDTIIDKDANRDLLLFENGRLKAFAQVSDLFSNEEEALASADKYFYNKVGQLKNIVGNRLTGPADQQNFTDLFYNGNKLNTTITGYDYTYRDKVNQLRSAHKITQVTKYYYSNDGTLACKIEFPVDNLTNTNLKKNLPAIIKRDDVRKVFAGSGVGFGQPDSTLYVYDHEALVGLIDQKLLNEFRRIFNNLQDVFTEKKRIDIGNLTNTRSGEAFVRQMLTNCYRSINSYQLKIDGDDVHRFLMKRKQPHCSKVTITLADNQFFFFHFN